MNSFRVPYEVKASKFLSFSALAASLPFNRASQRQKIAQPSAFKSLVGSLWALGGDPPCLAPQPPSSWAGEGDSGDSTQPPPSTEGWQCAHHQRMLREHFPPSIPDWEGHGLGRTRGSCSKMQRGTDAVMGKKWWGARMPSPRSPSCHLYAVGMCPTYQGLLSSKWLLSSNNWC